MESENIPGKPAARNPRFWVGPLLAGCCFTLGYGITHRLVTLQSNPVPRNQSCSLRGISRRFTAITAKTPRSAQWRSQADISAIEARREAELQAQEQARLEAERLAAATQQLEQAFQPVLDETGWVERPLIESVEEERIQSELEPFLESTVQPVAMDESPPQPSSVLLPPQEPVLPVAPAPSDPQTTAP